MSLDPTSLILLHTVMMWTIALVFAAIAVLERGWGFPVQWAVGFFLMPLVMVVGGLAERHDHDGLRVIGMVVGWLGPAILVDGMRAFVHAPPRPIWWAISLALLVVAVSVFTYAIPSLPLRFLSFQVFIVGLTIYGLLLVTRLPKEDHALGRPVALATGAIPLVAVVMDAISILLGGEVVVVEQSAFLVIAATVIALAKAIGKIIVVAERMAAKVGRDARIDALTGLATRRAFDQALAQEIARSQRTGRPVATILFDIDFFKSINDTHGHDVGDLALQRVAEIARAAVRPTDTVARLGGDEFAVLLPETDTDAARSVAERILSTMRATAIEVPAGATVRLAGSFGVSAIARAADPQYLLKRADEALYVVKRRGRNGVEVGAALAS
ncbi:MAG: GGDEF domain-containing protein [Alphaproteobacteria bacterium]|nr:GGDEF domain-containing protein [Alphaproteobacteria bacterium]TAD87823.1 MAG: GGDEF domain-containing protein [Alphaproteobacteria bacterium]